MRNMFLFVLLIALFSVRSFCQLTFPSDRYTDFTTKTLLATAVKQDTGYTSYVHVPQKIQNVIIYCRIDSASTSDSLKVEAYESADATNWVLTNTMATMTAIGTSELVLQNVGRYLKLRYYVQGASSAFKFSLKAVPK